MLPLPLGKCVAAHPGLCACMCWFWGLPSQPEWLSMEWLTGNMTTGCRSCYSNMSWALVTGRLCCTCYGSSRSHEPQQHKDGH